MGHAIINRDLLRSAPPIQKKDQEQAVVSLGDLCQSASTRSQSSERKSADHMPVAIVEAKDVVVLRQALDDACAFLEEWGYVGPGKRRQIALCILRHAGGGLRDPQRLAVKAIARIGRANHALRLQD